MAWWAVFPVMVLCWDESRAVFPVMAVCPVASSVAFLVKVWYWGEFLALNWAWNWAEKKVLSSVFYWKRGVGSSKGIDLQRVWLSRRLHHEKHRPGIRLGIRLHHAHRGLTVLRARH